MGENVLDRGDMRLSRSDDFKFAEDLITLKCAYRYDISSVPTFSRGMVLSTISLSVYGKQ